ncbi:MAG: efflux RND transporter periplasmic adaptor subunit [Pseudomonadales bacterium]|nr:efflux RND transporter periplasmic adaptor subunit [Pseudomonadales bacterium]
MNKSLKIIIPVALFLVAVAISWILITQKPEIVHKPVEVKHPLVSVAEVQPETISIPVFTRGTVTPGTEIQLTSEVGGQVLSISPNFANGGFFRKGDELLRIDPLEYEVNIKRAEASVAQARQALLQARAEKKARERVKGGNRNALATYEVQVKQAEAAFAAAQAELKATQLQRQKTIINAPFDGRVRMKAVNVGQYVRPGLQLGSIYAVDVAEVRLPLSDRQVGLVDVPLDFDSVDEQGTMVTLVGEYGGEKFYWPGEIVRSEGGLDERNRLLYVVAQVESPYTKDPNQPGRPPLASGFFVEAKIKGKTHENMFVVPRRALRNGNQVWIVDAKNQLQRRNVDVLYKGKTSIYIKSGLRNGDKVVLSQLDIAVDGMTVRTSIQESERRETADDQNLLGVSSPSPTHQAAVPQSATNPRKTATGVVKQFSASEVKEVASKMKSIVDSMDDDTKQQVTDNAKKMAEALKGIVNSTQQQAKEQQPVTQEPTMAAAENKSQLVAEPEPIEIVEEAKPEPPTESETKMSPLADLIAQDMETESMEEDTQEMTPEQTANQEQVNVATSMPESSSSSESTTSAESMVAITKAVAPEPLMEAAQ